MNSTQSIDFTKVCASRAEDVAALVDMKVMFAKPTSDKCGEARAPLRMEATMSPSRKECRNECTSVDVFLSAYNAASKEQQLAAGFDIITDTSKMLDTDESRHSALFLTSLLMGCLGLGIVVGRCK